MYIYIVITFGILGICLGSIIAPISNKIISYKNNNRIEKNPVTDYDKQFYIAIVSLNGFLWIYAGIILENIFTAFLVSLIFMLAILISVIDMRIRLIPNELTILMIVLGVIFQIVHFGWMTLIQAFICMVAVGIMFTLAGKFVGLEQVGAGDVKLAAAIGLVLGYPYIKIALIGMSITLIIFCLLGLLTKKMTVRSTFPFAPFIMFGTVIALIYIIYL